jgi:hypothetical protein
VPAFFDYFDEFLILTLRYRKKRGVYEEARRKENAYRGKEYEFVARKRRNEPKRAAKVEAKRVRRMCEIGECKINALLIPWGTLLVFSAVYHC